MMFIEQPFDLEQFVLGFKWVIDVLKCLQFFAEESSRRQKIGDDD